MNYTIPQRQPLNYPVVTQARPISTKSSLYFRKGGFTRMSAIKVGLLRFFHELANYPRLFLEVTFRSGFGERYFGLHAVIGGFLLLLLTPFIIEGVSGRGESESVFARHFLWYGYLLVFAFSGIKRYIEMGKQPGVFDFARYTKTNGSVHPRLMQFWADLWLRLFGTLPSPRTMEIYLEPLPFFVLGVLGWFFDPMFGWLMMICSAVYSASYMAEYWLGDQFIMDMIDEWIMAEQTEKAMLNDLTPEQTKGVNFRFKKPADPKFRQHLADAMVDDGEPAAAVF